MNNRSRPPRTYCLYITGFAEDIERRVLKSEFSKFGHVEKLFVDQSNTFAKVTYADKSSGDKALREVANTYPDWKVQYFDDSYKPNQEFNPAKFQSSPNKPRMASYGNYYEEEEDFSENFEYCNIHGQPLTVLQAESGDLYINLKDLKRTGFVVFRRDNFNSVLIDKRQIEKEFELHLLSEAKNYILKNRVAVIDEEVILQTIKRCKSKLLGEDTESRNSFGAGRVVAPSSKHNITITSPTPSGGDLPMIAQPPNQRPPKTLPSNFMPTNTQRNGSYRSTGVGQQGTRPNQNNAREYRTEEKKNAFVNGFDVSVTEQWRDDLNASFESRGSNGRQGQRGNGQPRKPRFREEIGKLTFEIGQTYDVQIVYTEKENIYWVHEKDNVLKDMFVEINEMEENLEPIEPRDGQLVIALYEEAWNRGRVINVDPLTVHFIDFGNKCEVKQVKALPEVFKKIPALAARITNNKLAMKDMDEVQIKIKQQYDDGTYLVEVGNTGRPFRDDETRGTKSFAAKKAEAPQDTTSFETRTGKPSEMEKPAPAPEKYYFDLPKPMGSLKHGDKVMMIDTEDNRFLVRTRECAVACKELTKYIANLDKTALTNVKVGQLVLCSKDGLVGLYRAVVTKKESASVVTVKYIDFPGEDDFSVKSLRNVDEFLANEPSTILLSPVHKSLAKLQEKAVEYIAKLCENKEKVTVVLSSNDFELQFEDGLLLSEKIQELCAPKPDKPIAKPAEEKPSTSKAVDKSEKAAQTPRSTPTETRVLYEDMDWIKIKPGTHTFMCYCLQDINDITMISTTDEVITYLEQITDLEVADDTPYKPKEFEMCLASFKGPEDEAASWYRSVVLEVDSDGYFVTFVDFGNKETVKCQDIRKFPVHLKEVPILGVNCKCVGIPDTPEILKHMKELIPEGEQVEVVVKGLDELACEIEIPDVYKKLKSKGLY